MDLSETKKKAAGGGSLLLLLLVIVAAPVLLTPGFSSVDELPQRAVFAVEPPPLGVIVGLPLVLLAVVAGALAVGLPVWGLGVFLWAPFRTPEPPPADGSPPPKKPFWKKRSGRKLDPLPLGGGLVLGGICAYAGYHALDYGLDFGGRHVVTVDVPANRWDYRCTYLGIPFRTSSGRATLSNYTVSKKDSRERFSAYTLYLVPRSAELGPRASRLARWWHGSYSVSLTIPHRSTTELHEHLKVLDAAQEALRPAAADPAPVDSGATDLRPEAEASRE